MYIVRLFQLATRVAAWATPYVQRWHRERYLNESEGERQLVTRNYSEAEKHLVLAVAEAGQRRYALPKRNRIQLQLAQAQRGQGKLQEAEATARKAMDDASSDRICQASCMEALSEIFQDRGDHASSVTALEEALGRDPADLQAVARRTSLLAKAREKQGKTDDALALHEKSAALHETAYGAGHIETGNRFSELGEIYRAQGRHADAQRCFRRALEIHEARCGAASHQATADLANLAASLQESGDLDGAVAQYERALRLKQRMVGVDVEQFAEMQVKVARMYIQWKRYGPARDLMSQAMVRLSSRPGPRRTMALETMADLEEASGHLAEAASLRSKALAACS